MNPVDPRSGAEECNGRANRRIARREATRHARPVRGNTPIDSGSGDPQVAATAGGEHVVTQMATIDARQGAERANHEPAREHEDHRDRELRHEHGVGPSARPLRHRAIAAQYQCWRRTARRRSALTQLVNSASRTLTIAVVAPIPAPRTTTIPNENPARSTPRSTNWTSCKMRRQCRRGVLTRNGISGDENPSQISPT